jgi:hypothetical protein
MTSHNTTCHSTAINHHMTYFHPNTIILNTQSMHSNMNSKGGSVDNVLICLRNWMCGQLLRTRTHLGFVPDSYLAMIFKCLIIFLQFTVRVTKVV